MAQTITILVSLLSFAVPQIGSAAHPTGPVAHWPADGNAEDREHGHDGTLENGATYGTGKIGQAFSLDGFNDIVVVPDHPDLSFGSGDDFTIEAWINLTSPVATHDDEIVAKMLLSPSGFSNGYFFRVHRGTRQLRLQIVTNGGFDSESVFSNSVIELSNWTHVVAVRSGTSGLLYVDGQLDNSGPVPDVSLANNAPLGIGGGYDTRFNPPVQELHAFGGLIDEVKIYDRALSDCEIAEAAGTGSCTLVAIIDIKPGSNHNPINLKSKGVIPVAVLTTDEFDATAVDGSTVRWAGAGVAHGDGHLEDVDGDGDTDWLGHFRTQETDIEAGDTEASLTGTADGQDIEGTDLITLVGGGKPAKKGTVGGVKETSWGELKRQ